MPLPLTFKDCLDADSLDGHPQIHQPIDEVVVRLRVGEREGRQHRCFGRAEHGVRVGLCRPAVYIYVYAYAYAYVCVYVYVYAYVYAYTYAYVAWRSGRPVPPRCQGEG